MSGPFTPLPTGALPIKDVPKLRFSQIQQPPSAEAGPEGSTGSRGTAPIDTINHFAGIGFDEVSNQTYGTCCPTGIGNLIRLTSGYYTDRQYIPSTPDVYDLYRRAGNPGFVGGVSVPDGPDDLGSTIQDALDEVRHNGMGTNRGPVYALAHATVDHTNEAELKAAMQIFGGLLYQARISTAQDEAYQIVRYHIDNDIPVPYDDPETWWDQFTGEDRGAHVTVAGAYEPTDFQDVISWGTRIPTTRHYRQILPVLEEVWVVIWPWTLEHPNFQEGVDYDALATAYHDLTGGTLPPKPTPTSIAGRWKSRNHVGAAKPRGKVMVRRGHYHRRYSADHVWQAVWVADSDWMVIPNVKEITLEHGLDNNGVRVATVKMDNVAYVTHEGAGGDYHKIERGWFSPLRAYKAPGRPSLFHEPNAWDRLLTDSVEIHISQGYGDQIVPTFSGLIDSANVGDLPDEITLSCRDFGLNLVDSKLFGWNIDPDKRDPVTFYSRKKVQLKLDSKTEDTRKMGANMQHKGIVIDDIADMVTIACRWGGWNVNNMRIDKTGANLKMEGCVFDVQSTLMDVIRKACDLTGYIFYIEQASGDHPNGRPIFKRPQSSLRNPPVFTEIRDDQLLTGVQYATDNTQKASIIRVRGKNTSDPDDDLRGGIKLGGDQNLLLTEVYRPPWHKTIYLTGHDRDARVLRHEIHIEPIYNTPHELQLACQQIALAQALAATTATVEIPGYPLFNLDQVLTLMDRPSGINSRMWVAHMTSTQTFGQTGTYKMSLGVALLDNPDVSEVVEDLIDTWRQPNDPPFGEDRDHRLNVPPPP